MNSPYSRFGHVVTALDFLALVAVSSSLAAQPCEPAHIPDQMNYKLVNQQY